MKYYSMVAREEEACPIGLCNAFLVPMYVKDVIRTEFGLHPWYAGPRRLDQPLKDFPGGLVLITKDSDSLFDIKSGSAYFYIASSTFIDCLHGLTTNILQIEEVEYVNYQGVPIKGKKYYAFRTKKILKDVALNLEKSSFHINSPRNFKNLVMKESLNLDVFDIAGLWPSKITLVCSEKAKDIFCTKNIKGVSFVEIEKIVEPPSLNHGELYAPMAHLSPI